MSDGVNEGSAAMLGSVVGEPVAWAIVLNAIEAISMNGGATYRVTANKEEADRIAAHAMAVVPLYEQTQPTLTETERLAIEWATVAARDQSQVAVHKTLRRLLERLK